MTKSGKGSGASGRRIGGTNITVNGKRIYISAVPESREDIRQLFINELGFKELYGTDSIPTAQLAAVGIELKKLEQQHHTLSNSDAYLITTHKKDTAGFAANLGNGKVVMALNPSSHKRVGSTVEHNKLEQAFGYTSRTNGSVVSNFTYTGRHEYGHLTQYSITNQTGKTASQIRTEVQSIARRKYKATSNVPSTYGSTNEFEYFAEAFASMTGGAPDAHGLALLEWMGSNT